MQWSKNMPSSAFAIQQLSLAAMHPRQNIIISFGFCMQVGTTAAGKAMAAYVYVCRWAHIF